MPALSIIFHHNSDKNHITHIKKIGVSLCFPKNPGLFSILYDNLDIKYFKHLIKIIRLNFIFSRLFILMSSTGIKKIILIMLYFIMISVVAYLKLIVLQHYLII
jgi:hypothetical protein